MTNIYYVDRNHSLASDSNAGNESHPWLTIQKGVNVATSGDTVIVKNGTYPERVVSVRNGESGQYISFETIGTVNMKGFEIKHDYIKIDGFHINQFYDGHSYFIETSGDYGYYSNNTLSAPCGDNTGAIQTTGNYNEFISNDISEIKYVNINLWGHDSLFESNIIHDNGNGSDSFHIWGYNHIIRSNTFYNINQYESTHSDLFQTYGSAGPNSYNILIENNQAFNCIAQLGHFESDGKINIRDWTFRNNLFVNISQQANIFATNFKFYNNTFYHCSQNTGSVLLFRINAIESANNGIVKNNMFIYCGSLSTSNPYWFETGVTECVGDYNYCTWSPPEYINKSGFNEINGINGGDPLFVDYLNNDFHLQANSPARNAGVDLSEYFTTDKDGVSRPQGEAWDIGAYEYTEFGCPDFCEGTTRYYNGIYDVETDKCVYETEENSLICEYVEPDCTSNDDCPNVCIGVDLYSQKCVNGICETNVLLETNSLQCEYVEPDCTSNSDCPDFCEGTTRYYNGSCVDGECVYDATTNSVDCGYVEPEPGETSSQYLIIGGIGLALLSMLNKK